MKKQSPKKWRASQIKAKRNKTSADKTRGSLKRAYNSARLFSLPNIKKLIIRASPDALCAAGRVFQGSAFEAFQKLKFLESFFYLLCDV